jgi:hypothetical protein
MLHSFEKDEMGIFQIVQKKFYNYKIVTTCKIILTYRRKDGFTDLFNRNIGKES